MLQLLQTLQIALFALSILGWLILGVWILVKPVAILHRRLFLLIFLPLLVANPLAFLEEMALPVDNASLDWRLWAVLAVDLALAAAGYGLLTGWQVYGLSTEDIESAIKAWFDAQGWGMDLQPAERKTFWGGRRMGTRLAVSRDGQQLALWLMQGGTETLIEGETSDARKLLRQLLPALNRVEKSYRIKDHLTGALYLVLAVVLAVLAWIFFFEPRFILLD